jgi:amylosucrase
MSSIETVLSHIAKQLAVNLTSADWQAFAQRAQTHGSHLHALLYAIYGTREDFAHQFKGILLTAAQSWLTRSTALKQLDAERETNPRWFQSNQMLGGIAYVDLFAGNLEGIRSKLPYFKELGLTYLHLMPLFEAPEGNSDGGYAVSSYRAVNPKLGTMAQLISLADELRENGISLCVDFIFNHTSDEHEWAKQAIAGDAKHREFYLIMPRAEADQYDKNLREIFPDQHPGAFTALSRWTGDKEIKGWGDEEKPLDPLITSSPHPDLWVWTTFNSFQWDTQTIRRADTYTSVLPGFALSFCLN